MLATCKLPQRFYSCARIHVVCTLVSRGHTHPARRKRTLHQEVLMVASLAFCLCAAITVAALVEASAMPSPSSSSTRWSSLSSTISPVPTTARFHIDGKTHQIVDEHGRSRIFHGVNVVYKPAPFYPPVNSHFDARLSLSKRDFLNLREWGVSIVRLYIAWEGVEPARGRYNDAYLDAVRAIVDEFAAYGIYVLLDAHQDAYTRSACGEGAPAWAVNATKAELAAFPSPVPNARVVRDNITGLPTIASCVKHNFGGYYFSHLVSSAFQRLYDNTGGVRDAFVAFWRQVARRFASAPNVIGYDMINEPWFGDVYAKPELLVPHVAESHNLQPLYNAVSHGIRTVDDSKLIFYEPLTSDYWSSGFTSVPGGKVYANKTVLSYHVYCPTYATGHGSSGPVGKIVCQVADSRFFDARAGDMARLGGGGMLTEFGAVGQSPSDLTEITRVCAMADAHMHGTIYWQFKSYGDYTTIDAGTESLYDGAGRLQYDKVKVLSRTYAMAVAGTPVSMTFTPATAKYVLVYSVQATSSSSSSLSPSTETVIFVNEAMWYAAGVVVTVSPTAARKATFIRRDHNRVIVIVTDATYAGTVTVAVSRPTK